jgi:predicted ester cyclase
VPKSLRAVLVTAVAAAALAVPLVAATAAPARPSPTPAAATAVPAGTCERPAPERAPRNARSAAYNRWLGETFTGVLLNTRDQAERVRILEQIVAVDYIQHNPLLAEGRQGLIDFLPVIYQAFPDACFVLRDAFATTDRVVTRWTWTGTLTGAPFLGIEPAGRRVEFDAIDIWTVRDGQLYEHWDQFDWPRAIVQLDADPSTPPVVPAPLVDAALRPADR